jgi:hypothetical protein
MNQADRVFYNRYHGQTNFVTPSVLWRELMGPYAVELSSGEALLDRTQRIYGVTVLHRDGSDTGLSRGGFSFAEAEAYLSTLEEHHATA